MQFPTCVLQEPTIKSGFMWRQLHDVARMHCSTFAQKGRHPEKAGAGSQGASQSCCGQMRTQRPECQPNLGKGHLGLWILNWFCKMKWHFMLVKLLYTHIYIYISKEEARTCPCKLDVFECFKIISDAKNVHHPFSYGTLLVPTIRDMNIILFGRACTFFHMDWMEYLGMWWFPSEIFRNGSNNLKHVHLFDLSLFSYTLKTS